MAIATADGVRYQTASDAASEIHYEKWNHWPVNWSAVWVGGLAAVAAVLVFGLMGVAVGAHAVGVEARVVDFRKIGWATLTCSLLTAFFSFVIGGWVAGKTAGILRSEPGMLYGGIVWLVATPLLVLMAGLGAGTLFGGWYAGLSGASTSSPYVRPELSNLNPSSEQLRQFQADQDEYRQNVRQWREDAPKVTRNSAMGAATALLIGLIGSVLGGWMASGEPMNFTHHLNRRPLGAAGINH
jgi:hypothetical protein